MNKLSKEQLRNRIIAIGESKEHAHVIVGDAEVRRNSKGEIIIEITGNASIKHILEMAWADSGREVSTEEHEDIDLTDLPLQVRQGDVFLEIIAPKTYKYFPQFVFDPLSKRIERVRE